MAPRKVPVAEAVEKRLQRGQPDECWLWNGQRDKDGYGRLSRRPKNILIHRWMWEQRHGQIPPGLQLRHRCDNPPCVNPDHLMLGTARDNKHDAISRDRHTHGSMIGTSKLTEETVALILRTPGTLKELAPTFGVHFSTIARIRRRERWKHVS